MPFGWFDVRSPLYKLAVARDGRADGRAIMIPLFVYFMDTSNILVAGTINFLAIRRNSWLTFLAYKRAY